MTTQITESAYMTISRSARRVYARFRPSGWIDADDLAHDIVIRYMQSNNRIIDLSGWSFRVATTTMIDHFRRTRLAMRIAAPFLVVEVARRREDLMLNPERSIIIASVADQLRKRAPWFIESMEPNCCPTRRHRMRRRLASNSALVDELLSLLQPAPYPADPMFEVSGETLDWFSRQERLRVVADVDG